MDNQGRIYIAGIRKYGFRVVPMIIRLEKNGKLDQKFNEEVEKTFESLYSQNSTTLAEIFPNSLSVDKNGKILIACDVVDSNDRINNYYSYACVFRLDSNGIIDKSFGKSGRVKIDYMDEVSSMFIDENGNIFLGGYSYSNKLEANGFIVKLKNNGDIDNSFGREGKIVLDNILKKNSNDYVTSIFVGKASKIYITGYTSENKDLFLCFPLINPFSNIFLVNSDVFVVRLNADGSVDKDFGGKLRRDLDGDGVNDTAILLDRIVGKDFRQDYGRKIFVNNNGEIYLIGESQYIIYSYAFVIKIE